VSSLAFTGKAVPQILAVREGERRRKGRKRRTRIRRLRKQREPKQAERALRTKILEILERARQLITERLIPRLPEIERAARIDSATRADVEPWPEIIARIMADIRAQFATAEGALQEAATIAADQTAAFNKNQVTSQLRAALGVDIFIAEPALGALLAASVSENVGLIKSIPQRFFNDVEQTILRQFRTGQRAESIAPEISRRFQVSRRRAAFIARDQVAKLNGDLTRMRQREVGIPGYIWRTSLDERVRPDHARLEGTKQEWDDPPVVDSRTGRRAHPGGDFNCRCTAEPDIEGLLDELAASPEP
jgi:SPP1 gp7 family putative phage head morphogenesis protein